MASPAWEDDEFELCNNNGFVYKRRKRRRSLEEEAEASTASEQSAVDLQVELKKRKKTTLGKIKDRYQKEILHWEILSNTLKGLEETAQQVSISTQSNSQFPVPESNFHSELDELFKQVEAQDAMLRNVSMLCDMAEVVLQAEEERLKEPLLSLPIWETSPRRVFATLCAEDNCNNDSDT